jgi:two-component system phosphate regulon response regulator PhoB
LRNIVYRFDDLSSFASALREGDQELLLPPNERVDENEWVLAIFELAPSHVPARGRATAAAARGFDRGDGVFALAFERRDWERLVEFSDGKSSSHMPVASPQFPDDEDSGSIPILVDPMPLPAEEPKTKTKSRPPTPIPTPPPESQKRASSRPQKSAFGAVGADSRVLLVDDDRDIREVVGAMLEAVGLKVETSSSAEDALEKLRGKKKYDLVVLDWNLPGMTGIELCRVLRRDPPLMAMPVLFLTAHASSKDIVEAFASGADDYVVKPFRAPELGARIFGLLRRVRLAQTST